MSRVCEICGRGTKTAFHVSHSKVKVKRTHKINLQSKKIEGKKSRVCTACIKSMAKKK